MRPHFTLEGSHYQIRLDFPLASAPRTFARNRRGHGDLALLAINGHNVDFEDVEKVRRRVSMAFWKPVLNAATMELDP